MNLPPCSVLKEMVTSGEVLMPDGSRKRATSGGIKPSHAWALYKTVLAKKPEWVVEIGMAQGVSTLSILCALSETGGKLISIDPYVGWPSGRIGALYNVERAGYSAMHRHIEAKSYEALPGLLRDGLKVNFGYIDGNHAFEHAFIDAFYLDRMLAVEGVLGFNDAGWLSVHRVIRFLQRNRKYEEMHVGLPTSYRGRNIVVTWARWLFNIPRQDRYFRKIEHADA